MVLAQIPSMKHVNGTKWRQVGRVTYQHLYSVLQRQVEMDGRQLTMTEDDADMLLCLERWKNVEPEMLVPEDERT